MLYPSLSSFEMRAYIPRTWFLIAAFTRPFSDWLPTATSTISNLDYFLCVISPARSRLSFPRALAHRQDASPDK